MSPHEAPNFTSHSLHAAEKTGTIYTYLRAVVGEPVWVWCSGDGVVFDDTQPWHGTVTYVHPRQREEGQCVNLLVTDHAGNQFIFHEVPLRYPAHDRHQTGKPRYATVKR